MLEQFKIFLHKKEKKHLEPPPEPYPFYKLTQKWITDLNVKWKTNTFRRKLTLFEESRRNSSGRRVRQRVPRLDAKNMINKISWTASKLMFMFCEKP